MEWKALIEDEILKKKILERIHSISDYISVQSTEDLGFIDGKAGISIFWEYFAVYSKNISHHINCVKQIESCITGMAKIPMTYRFGDGISGILWAFSHLVHIGAMNENLNKTIGDEINKFLFESSNVDILNGEYDYLYGGLSTLPYLLERYDNELCRGNIHGLIKELEKISQKLPEGIAWMVQSYFLSHNKKHYNLGMAHGMPSIIVLLSRVLEKNIATEKVNKLLERLVKWLLAQKQDDGTKGFFPNIIPTTQPYYSRVAWCYGDLGISIAIMQAGMITNNNVWKEEAKAIAKNAALRKQPGAGTVDTCFCHGTAGNAHLFNRLYHYTGIQEFKDAAIYWYIETLRMYEATGHFKYLIIPINETKPSFQDRIGLLEGLSGIGLTLLAAISDIEPKWDRCFLLS